MKDIINEIQEYLDPVDEEVLSEISNKQVRDVIIQVVNKLKTFGVTLSKTQQKEVALIISQAGEMGDK